MPNYRHFVGIVGKYRSFRRLGSVSTAIDIKHFTIKARSWQVVRWPAAFCQMMPCGQDCHFRVTWAPYRQGWLRANLHMGTVPIISARNGYDRESWQKRWRVWRVSMPHVGNRCTGQIPGGNDVQTDNLIFRINLTRPRIFGSLSLDLKRHLPSTSTS